MQSQTAVVLGATGLIGNLLVQQLLNDAAFSKVSVLVRKGFSLAHPKLETILVNFADHNDFTEKTGKADCLFCCIGTTQKKVKGDKTAYRKVDYDIPVQAAGIATLAGFKKYMLVSAVGADAGSSNFYLKLKGEVERDISTMQFESIHIFQPSILLGHRTEFRIGELVGKGLMQVFSFMLAGSYSKYKPVQASDVAKAMITASKNNTTGIHIYRYDEIKKLIC